MTLPGYIENHGEGGVGLWLTKTSISTPGSTTISPALPVKQRTLLMNWVTKPLVPLYRSPPWARPAVLLRVA